MWNLIRRNFGLIFVYNLFFRSVFSGINNWTGTQQLALITQTQNAPRNKLSQNECETYWTQENKGYGKECCWSRNWSFHWNRTYYISAERSMEFLKKKKKCCFEHKNKVCLDHWVPLFLHLILLFYGNISSKLRSFGTQKTVGVWKIIHENKHNLAIVSDFSFAIQRNWEMLSIFRGLK